jgi:PAS domain S-box-containing protein
MDKLENDHKPEEVAEITSQLRKRPPDKSTQGNIEKDVDTQQRLERNWRSAIHWFRASTFTPEWLTAPWNHPVVGYLFALLLPVGSIILALLLRQIFLTFVLPGVLIVMAILVVAILWGTGPGVLATLWGTILFNFIVLSPRYTWSLDTLQHVFETCFLLVLGMIISLVVSRIEHARAEAVTARKELEAAHVALQRSQGYASRLFDSNLIGILLADHEHIYEANESFLRMVGYNREDLASGGLRWREMTPPDFMPLGEYAIKELYERGECTPFEKEYIRKDGSHVPIFIGAAVIEKDPLRWVCFVLDLTERKRLEQQTHKALYALLAMAKVIVQESDEIDTTQHETSEQPVLAARNVAQHLAELTCSFLGCKRLSISIVEPDTEYLRPLAVVGLTPAQERQWWDEQLQRESRLTDGPDLVLVQRLQADEVVLLDMTQPPWSSFPNPFEIRTLLLAPMSISDRLVGLLALDYAGKEHTYTSEELALAGGVAKLTTLLIERERLLRERAKADARELALRQAKERMDEFLSIVSHELRTPLTTIKGNIQLARLRLRSSLREVPADNAVLQSMLEEIQLMLERAERQTNVQNRMVSDLLDISRLQADKLELRLVPCDLATIVLELVEDQRSTTPKRALSLKMPEGETAPILADPERIGQVLNNYLTNALKYSPVDRPVEVQLKKQENMVRVLVRDEGPGLTPSEQEQVWERFYQVEGIKRQRGASVGLGLGLHICREIVEQHQGEVGVESTKGEGSTFWFTLPFSEPADQEAV